MRWISPNVARKEQGLVQQILNDPLVLKIQAGKPLTRLEYSQLTRTLGESLDKEEDPKSVISELINQIYFPLPENPNQVLVLVQESCAFPTVVIPKTFAKTMSFKLDIDQMIDLSASTVGPSYGTLKSKMPLIELKSL